MLLVPDHGEDYSVVHYPSAFLPGYASQDESELSVLPQVPAASKISLRLSKCIVHWADKASHRKDCMNNKRKELGRGPTSNTRNTEEQSQQSGRYSRFVDILPNASTRYFVHLQGDIPKVPVPLD